MSERCTAGELSQYRTLQTVLKILGPFDTTRIRRDYNRVDQRFIFEVLERDRCGGDVLNRASGAEKSLSAERSQRLEQRTRDRWVCHPT